MTMICVCVCNIINDRNLFYVIIILIIRIYFGRYLKELKHKKILINNLSNF